MNDEPGINFGSDANSSSVRTSMIAGECGSPIKRKSCETVISVVDGTGVLLKRGEEKDAIFGLPPHEVIAKNPLCRSAHHESDDVKRIARRCRKHTSCPVFCPPLGGESINRAI